MTTIKSTPSPRRRKTRRVKSQAGRPSVGIRELKAKASAIVDDVKTRCVTYAVTKHGAVEALIVPADLGARLLDEPQPDAAWAAWQALVDQLALGGQTDSALDELSRMRR